MVSNDTPCTPRDLDATRLGHYVRWIHGLRSIIFLLGPPYGPPDPAPPDASLAPEPRIDWSPSPPSPPKRRGRPPKKALTAAATAAKTSSQQEKENVAIDIDISSDSETEEGRPKYKHWADIEKTKFFNFTLAFDEVGNHRFEQLKKNPNRVFTRASEILFPGTRSAKSIVNLWTRSSETFTWMVQYEKFTGNGGGDPDSDDPTAILKNCLEAARSAGLNLGTLRPETITARINNGWFDLFNDRPVDRQVVRNSTSALSDLDDNENLGTTQDSDDNINPLLLEKSRAAQASAVPKTPAPRKNPAALVSEPKYTLHLTSARRQPVRSGTSTPHENANYSA
ncbi:hypothetical protein FB451DRAFT_1557276 [Mycena latifolia]|nr:hypothetical protein FB451DRAFT_1557276 [Mycena latifolia]